MLKHILAIALCVVMTVSMLPVQTFATENAEEPAVTEPVATEPAVTVPVVTEPEVTVESMPAEEGEILVGEEEILRDEAMNAAITDYSGYTFQLWSASNGGASGPMYMYCYYMNYQWWTRLEWSNNVNDRFETRVRFEKDASTGKYRLFYYGVHKYDDQLFTRKYYLTGATVPTSERTESNGFYYGSDYGYEYITFTTSASSALLWEVTSSGYLKTTYKSKTHYLWTTDIPYGDNWEYIFRLRTTTTAKGSRGMPIALSEYNWFWLSNYHAHTPGEKQVTGTVPATCK